MLHKFKKTEQIKDRGIFLWEHRIFLFSFNKREQFLKIPKKRGKKTLTNRAFS